MRVPKIGRRLRRVGLLVGLVTVLAACGNNNGQNSLHPKGPYAQKIHNLFVPIVILAIIIGIAVLVATVYFAFKFRYREGKPDNPKQIHGSTPLEIGWTIVPALILAVVAVPTIATIFDLAKKPTGPNVLNVTVAGKQWWWQFELPKQPMVDKKVVTSTELHIPVNTKVYLSEVSDNVIHSFWVPELNGKKDVMPGQTNHNTIEADKPGTFLGACAEYCGLSHANMRFRVIARDPIRLGAVAPPASSRARANPGPGRPSSSRRSKYACTNCHVFDDSTKDTDRPNLTHLDEPLDVRGWHVRGEPQEPDELGAERAVDDRDGVAEVPRAAPGPCVGMPSFTKNTPKGLPVMTQADADTIVTYLLGEK